ncbi:MAG: hypothetical protein PF637_06090 [Spirochaetes bacterium]|jgi:hypothetical protein|nr:hypothetical protein [Spirochaetota bacterium]
MSNSNFKYTSRSYQDIYFRLKEKYPHYDDSMFSEIAGMFDTFSEVMNAVVSDLMDPKTRESAYFRAAFMGYDPVESEPATTVLTVKLRQEMTKTFQKGEQFSGISSISGDYIYYEVPDQVVVTGETVAVPVKQQRTYTGVEIGKIQRSTEFAEIHVRSEKYRGLVKSSLEVFIEGEKWNRVTNFDKSGVDDKDYVVCYKNTGEWFISFGDGVKGKLPNLSDVVTANFAVTKGLAGRMKAGEINQSVSNDPDIEVVTNIEDVVNGNDPETVSSILRNAAATTRLRDAIFYDEDLEIAAMKSSSSVVKAKGKGESGIGSIYIVPAGGGIPTVQLKEQVFTFVQKLTAFENQPLNVLDPPYVQPVIQAQISFRKNVLEEKKDVVRAICRFALILCSSAVDIQVLESFADNGIDVTRRLIINPIWGIDFTAEENGALAFIVRQWEQLLGARKYRDFGQSLELGDLYIMGNGLYDYGVDEFHLISPTAITVIGELEIVNSAIVEVL